MFVDQSIPGDIEAAIDAGVSAYVVDGFRKERIKPVLDLAVSRFNAFARLQNELNEARNALADRKAIDKAKALLKIGRASCREKSVSVRVDLGGRRIIKKKTEEQKREQDHHARNSIV